LHWQAAAWWLERSFPGRYGRRGRREIANADGPIRVEVERPRSPERLRELLKVAVELGWAPSADGQTNGNAAA
jgi:hypothetical protein